MSEREWTYVRGPCLPSLRKLSVGCAGLVLTDPPYGTEGKGDGYGRRSADGIKLTIANDGGVEVFAEALPHIYRALSDDSWAVFFRSAAWPERRDVEDALVGSGFTPYGEMVWDKGAPGLGYTIRYNHEALIVASKGTPPKPPAAAISVLRHPPVTRSGCTHPHEKPVPVLRRIIRWALPNGGHVLDPFAGIASAGVAALLEGCTYTGMEIDPQWWDIAERRLTEVTDNTHGLGLFDTEAA